MFVNYGIFSFADINVGGLAAIRSPSVYFLYVTYLYEFLNCPLDCRNTAFGIFSYPLVRRIAVFVLALSVAQVTVDALRGKGQIIFKHALVAFHL
jgi:hypothetical protein